MTVSNGVARLGVGALRAKNNWAVNAAGTVGGLLHRYASAVAFVCLPLAMLLASATAAAVVLASGATATASSAPIYLSLGDSLSVGVQPDAQGVTALPIRASLTTSRTACG